MSMIVLRRLGLGLAVLVGAVFLLAGGLLLFLHTGPGERWVAGAVERAVPGLTLDNYQLGWPFRMRAERLRLADGDGPWLEVAGAEMVWHPLRLARGTLDIDRLVARRVDVKRLPAGGGGGGGRLRLPETLLLDEAAAAIRLEAPVLGEPVDLDFAGTFQMKGGGGTVDLTLRSNGGGFAHAEGNAGLDYLDLRWYLRVPHLEVWRRLAGMPLAGAASGSGNVVGRLPSPEISGRVDLGPGHGGDAGWNTLVVMGRVVPQGALWQVGLQAQAQRPSWQGKAYPDATLAVAGDVTPGDGSARLGHVRLSAAGTRIDGAVLLSDWGRWSYARLNSRLDLAALGIGSGFVRLRAQLAGDLTRPALDGMARVEGDGVATGIAVLDRALGPRPRGVVAAHFGGDRLGMASARLTGARARIDSVGRVEPRLGLWTRLDVPDLSVIDPILAGSGTALGRIGGEWATPGAFGVARLDGLRVGEGPPGQGEVMFDLADLAHAHGPLSADARLAGVPLQGRARLQVGQGVRLDDLAVTSGASRLAGDLLIKDGVRGHLTGAIPELRQWEALLGRPLAGRVEADAVLDPGQGQSLRLSLKGSELDGFGLHLPNLDGSATLTGLTRNPAGTATLATQAEFAGHRLDGVRLAASGRWGEVVVEQAEARLGPTPLRLTAPVRLRWGKGKAALQPAAFALGSGRLSLEGNLAGQQVDGRARLEGVPLALVDAAGTLSGSVTARGFLPQPDVRFSLTGRNLAVAPAGAGLGRMVGHMEGGWSGGRVQAKADLTDSQGLSAEAEAVFPLPGEGPLSGHFSLSGDAGRLAEALPLAGHVFAGRVQAAGSLGGTLAAPTISGRASLAEGRYDNLDNGTVITGLGATADFAGDRLELRAEGGDGGKGRVRLAGSGSLDGSYGADISFTDFTLLRRDEVEAAVTGTARLDGAGDQARIAGQLTVPRAEVDIGRLKGAGPVRLEVTEINLPPGKAKPAAKPQGAEAPVTMALAVKVGIEHAFVRGRGLDSEWQGNVDVGGTLSQPSLTGKVAVVRGQFDFLGKAFRLANDSTVAFEGGETIDPALAVTADANAADVTAQVQVTGTAKDPQLAITSQPPLPQDEVLARVLFGRSAGSLSAFQQVQLAQLAASGLTGGGGGFDPIGQVRGFLGLDVLGVGSAQNAGTANANAAGSTGPTLSAGKYIGPDTFVRVEQGTAGLGTVTVEQDIGAGFSLESSVGEQSGGGVGFNWRKDY